MAAATVFVYGGYTHPEFEVNTERWERIINYSPRYARRTMTVRMTVTGELQYSSVGAITDAINQLENAYTNDGQGDFGLFGTPHFLYNDLSIGGVKIKHFAYPQGDAAEYATKRTYTIVAEAEYFNIEDQIVDFQETLSYSGNGGPRVEVYACAKGPPQQIVHALQTPQRVVQYGRIVGLQAYPITPGPIYPAYEHFDQRQFNIGSPRKYGKFLIDWPLQYAYFFSLPISGSALPNVR